MYFRCIVVLVSVLALAGCDEPSAPSGWKAEEDQGIAWVKHSAEFQALSLQAYHQAERALPGFIADRTWTAMPGQTAVEYLPPAIIFDVDETVVTGVDFQLAVEYPVNQQKLNDWNSTHDATPIQGFAKLAQRASSAGVELFFITNRPCGSTEGLDDPCPYERTAIDDIREAGFETDDDHVMLFGEKEGWTKEKLVRREVIARSYRVIMIVGDDLSDFIPCVRSTATEPCTKPGTAEYRKRMAVQFGGYWGNGWYILPNPMHGSWLSAR